MRKILILSAVLGLFFTSCSYVSDYDQTSCVIEVDSDFVSGMRAALQKIYDDRTHVRINVECTGGYNTFSWKDATIGTLSSVVFTFDDVPYGKKFDIYVGIYYGSELIYSASQNDICITSTNPTLELSLLLSKMLNTDYVLYNKDENSRYNFYLADSPSAGSNGLAFSSDSGYFAFDAEGYFYTIDGSTIYSNNPDFSNDGIAISSIEDIKSFTIDRLTGLFYFMAGSGEAAKLYKAKRNQASFDTPVSYGLAFENVNPPARGFYNFAVNNGILYIVLQGKDLYKNNPVLVKADLSTLPAAGSVGGTVLCNLGDYVTMTSKSSISDLLYQNGALYILENEFYFPESLNYYDDGYKANTFYSRGLLVKYDLLKATVDKIGWTSNESDTSSGKLHVYYDGNMCYADKDCIIPKTVSKASDGLDLEKYNCFPKLLLPASEKDGFYGPQKFIAIKSDKLVIADDGAAFYKDAEAWKYKNINRVVTVDLDKFTFSSVNAAVDFDDKKLNKYILSSESHLDSALPFDSWYKKGNSIENALSQDRYVGIPLGE